MIKDLSLENLTHAFPEVAFDEDYIIGTFQMRAQTKNIEKLSLAIAAEQTTGTWIKVNADSLTKQKEFGAKVVSIYEVPDFGGDKVEDLPPMYIIQIAFPMRNIGPSIPMMLTTIFGNISASGMIKWIDVAFPKKYVAQFKGPKFGVQGLRDLLGVHDRPLLNAMIKPNTGWTPDEGAEIFYNAARGGVDLVKDDELMPADEDFCPLKERVSKFMAKEKQAFEETGEHTIYTVNITDKTDKIRDNAMRAIECGANGLMLNVYTSGHGSLQMLAEDPDINVPILAHVDFVGAYANSTYTGVSAPLVIGKLTRLAGGDFQINGHPWGKFPIQYKTFYRSFKFFTQPWWNIKPMMYAASGGTTQLVVKNVIDEVGIDVILAAGGGVHGHPDGSCAGAKSMRQAIDAALKGIDLIEYAKDHEELMGMAKLLNPDVAKNFDLMQ
ncbi:MAG: RuBisCO large subunit C-terminal-like domain-containing protein [Clostridiales bacterium]|nr:RuBisCO large subunit C-terminal-like domain-containing protein [Clostridiales bacterium]